MENPFNADGLRNLCATTTARLAVGRAGPRPQTRSLLLFQSDHAVTQDAIFGDVRRGLKAQFHLFTVQTQVADQDEYLLRPDLGRKLSDEAKRTITERCVKKPQVQIVVGDGLSAAAVTNNLPQIYPVIEQGLQAAGIRIGTPFFVRYGRVGVINDINEIVGADVVLLLIGERPGPGRGRRAERLLGLAARPRQDRRPPRRDLHDHRQRRHQPARRRALSWSSTDQENAQIPGQRRRAAAEERWKKIFCKA